MSTLYELFKIASNTFTNNYAVISFNEANYIEYVTYQSLLKESEYLSKCLQDDLMCRPRPRSRTTNGPVIIGLYLEQTICFPALVLGILQQSLAFLCLNLNTTEEDFLSVSETLHLTHIISVKNQRDSQLIALDKKGTLIKEININGIEIEIWHMPRSKSRQKSTRCIPLPSIPHEYFTLPVPESVAYVVMTSGTCGKPKVVRVPHQCIVPNIQTLRTILNIGSDDVIFLAAPLSFDPSIVELFLALASGAAILIVPNLIKMSPNLLLEALFPEPLRLYAGTTILQMTPSVLCRWSDETIRNVLFGPTSTLRALVLGGEPCPSLATLKRWRTPESRTEIYNIYGITEVSCWASLHKVDIFDESAVAVPLGSALSETILQVRNEAGEVISDGEGEVFIGSISRVCQIDTEAEARNLSSPLFRATGDVVNVSKSNSNMFFVSRKNGIIKRWGHRVNLLQIEESARQCAAVENCSCVWDPSINTLCLFVKTGVSTASLRSYLTNLVHPASIPDLVLNVPDLPLTPHGKVDMRQLRHVLRREVEGRRVKSAVATFTDLWLSHLDCAEVGPGDTFSRSGGSSIKAVQIAAELERAGHDVPSVLLLNLLKGSTFEQCCGCFRLDETSTAARGNDSVNSEGPRVNEHAPEIDNRVESPAKRIRTGTERVTKHEHCKLLMSSCRGKTLKYPEGIEVTHSILVSSTSCISLSIGWKFDLGKCVDASPLCVDYSGGRGKVVVGSHSHNVAILDSLTGELTSDLCRLPDRVESSACVSVCGRYAFVGCYDGAVYCLNLETSGTEWIFQTNGMVKSSPSLCMDGAAITFGSYDKSLYCVRVTDGSLVWSVPTGGSVFSSPRVSRNIYAAALDGTVCSVREATGDSVFSSPPVSRNIYAAALDGTVCSVREATGETEWSRTLATPVFSSPTPVHDGAQVLFAEVAGRVHSLCSRTGTQIWTFQADGNIFSSFCTPPPRKNKQIILFGCHDKHLYCLEASLTQAHLVWKSKLDSAVFATPIAISVERDSTRERVTDEPVDGDESLVVVASVQGSVRLVSLSDGTERCRLTLPHQVFSSPTVSGNQIIVGCRDNNVYSLNIMTGTSGQVVL